MRRRGHLLGRSSRDLPERDGRREGDYPVLTGAAQTLYSSLGGAEGSAAETGVRSVMVGAGTVWRMTCQVHDAPGEGSARRFTVRQNDAASSMSCAITGASTQCTPAAGAASAPIAFAAGDHLATEQASTSATSVHATQGSCVLLVSYDTAM